MKKLISLLAAVAMVSTLFVSVVKADFAPTVITEKEQLSNSDFYDLIGEDIPTGYDAYLVTVSFANLGDLNCEIKTKKHSGRKVQGFGYQMTFDNISNVETDYVLSVDNVFGVDLSEGFVGSKFTSIFNAGSASAAYPTTAATITNSEGIEDAALFVVTVKNDATVVATLDTNMKVVTYTSNTPGTEEQTNHATMSPASLTFAPAAAPTTYTYTFKTADGTGTIASADIAEGETVTAPTAPEIGGKDFVGWATSVGGAVVTVDSTSKADTTYYAVYEDSAPAYVEIPADTTQAQKVADPSAKTYKDYDNSDVTLKKSYAIARFVTAIDSAKSYTLHAEATSGSKDFDLSAKFGGIEISGTANFITIVKNAPEGTVLTIREQ